MNMPHERLSGPSNWAGGTKRVLPLPPGGLFAYALAERTQACEPGFVYVTGRLGDLRHVRGELETTWTGDDRILVTSAGTATDETDALGIAYVEGIERYSAAACPVSELVYATAQDLGSRALSLDSIPCCSPSELAYSACPLVEPDDRSLMRWVKALSLLDGRVVYVPAVMVYIAIGYVSAGERIALPISTGCAAYHTYEGAVLRGILEVVERDAASIVWLQELSLPRIDVDCMTEPLRRCWELCAQRVADVDYVFLDATTDLGIPTVYGIRAADADREAARLVACAADVTLDRAVAKVIRDFAAAKIDVSRSRRPPDDWHDFKSPMDGAQFMAHGARTQAFEFLLTSSSVRSLASTLRSGVSDDRENLGEMLAIFKNRAMDVYVADLSTDEAIRSGLRVVRVIIPALQPLSFHTHARYLGHRRLYEAPRHMGHPVRDEPHLNRWPQPLP